MSRALVAATVMALTGCMTPKLTKHYEQVSEDGAGKGALELSVFLANPKNAEEPPLITSLSERGQAALIKTVAEKLPEGSDAAKLLATLSTAQEAPVKPCAWASKDTVTKRFTITLLGDLKYPADRVDKLQIDLKLPANQVKRAKFASWDRFESKYDSYDLGSAKYTQSGKVNFGRKNTDTANLPADAGSLVKVFDAGVEASRSLEESMQYAIRRLSVGGALTPERASLVQEGGPYINLLGSSSAVITLKLTTTEDPHPVYAVRLAKGAATPAGEVTVTRCLASYPSKPDAVELDVSGTALRRLVIDQHATLSEADDMVRYTPYPLLLAKPLTIATREELTVNYFGLARCASKTDGLSACQRLFIENPITGKVTDELQVQSAEDAAKLRSWLVANLKAAPGQASLGNLKIGIARSKDAGDGDASDSLLSTATAKELRVVRLGGNDNR